MTLTFRGLLQLVLVQERLQQGWRRDCQGVVVVVVVASSVVVEVRNRHHHRKLRYLLT